MCVCVCVCVCVCLCARELEKEKESSRERLQRKIRRSEGRGKEGKKTFFVVFCCFLLLIVTHLEELFARTMLVSKPLVRQPLSQQKWIMIPDHLIY